MTRSLLNLPRVLLPLFCLGYLSAQAALLVRAQTFPDHVFGFQMFNASSELQIALYRKLRANGRSRVVPVRDGTWTARDASGKLQTFRWQDRIRDPVLQHLDRFVHASYGLEGQLFRLQFALKDRVANLGSDAQTRGLVAVVDTVKNGRERRRVRLQADRP